MVCKGFSRWLCGVAFMSFNIIALEMWRKLCYNVSSAVLGTVLGDIAAINAVICESARDNVRC